MIETLRQLARQGSLEWLSFHFAEFVARHSPGEADPLLILSAALVCDANQRGSACIHLSEYAGGPVFDSEDPALRAPRFTDWIECLQRSPLVGGSGEHCPLTLDLDRLYLNRYWWYECRVAEQILFRLGPGGTPESVQPQDIDAILATESTLDDDQRRSVLLAASSQFCVVSGGPGSGKTSTVVRILSVLLDIEPQTRIALAAPTGKAAARMLDSIERQLAVDDPLRERLPDDATTLHRLLGYRQQRFGYDATQPLPFDCVVVDEASMIDLQLMHHLLDALSPRARLILLGDRDQLASVSAGNVLGDITGHGLVADVIDLPIGNALSLLRHNYRFASDSTIAALATHVNRGDAAAAEALLSSGDGLVWHRETQAGISAGVLGPLLDDCKAVFGAADPAAALDAYDRSQILCAINFGTRGVYALNRKISETLLGPQGQTYTDHFHGLPLMIQRNDYELGLFNGDTGILWDEGSGLRAWFRDGAGGLRDIGLNRLPEYLPAWAISVHKSQGSEFDRVLLLLPEESVGEGLTRELLYTAISRARHEFRLLASPEVLRHTVNRLTRRHSGLAVRLGWPESGPSASA